MAKVFDLVKAEGFNTLATAIRNSTAAVRQEISNYLLSNLQHFHVNGKKVDVLQEAVDLVLTERYRDIDVVEITLRALTPIDFTTEAGHGKKKWINIVGEKVAKDQGDPKKVKQTKEANTAKWRNSFEVFAKGEPLLVQNPDFFKGVNDGLKEEDENWKAEKVAEDFNQDIYALVDRLKEIQTLKAVAKADRDGASSDAVIAQSLNVGATKRSLDTLYGKVIGALGKVSDDYIGNASEEELKALDSYGDEMEKTIAKMQEKLEAMRQAAQQALATVEARRQQEHDEKILAEAQAIMAARSQGVEETNTNQAV